MRVGDLLVTDRVLPAIEGDVLALEDAPRTDVGPSCLCTPRAYACLSCRVRLANAYQVELHVERGGHVLAQLCPVHGAVELRP